MISALLILAGLLRAEPMLQTDTLENGLVVAWFPNSRVPLVDLVLWVPRGERDDPKGKYGTSRLLSDLTEEQGKALEELGATVSSSSGSDSFSVAIHGLSSDLPEFLKFLKSVPSGLRFSPKDLETLRSRVRDELTHLEDRASTLAVLSFQHRVAQGTPYARGPLQARRDLARIQLPDLLDWMKRNFRAKGAVLLVAGQVDRLSFLPKIKEAFGAWAGEGAPRSAVKAPPPLRAETLVTHRPMMNQAQIMMGFRGPLYRNPDRFALAIANALFGEYFNSRLNRLVREELGLTYSIGSQWAYNQDLGVFSISASTENNSVGLAVSKIREELKTFAQGAITQEELESARDYLIGSHFLRTDSVHSMASHWLTLRAFGAPEDLGQYEAGLRAVDLQKLKRAVKAHLNPNQVLTVIAGDAGPIRKSLTASKIKSVRVKLQDLN